MGLWSGEYNKSLTYWGNKFHKIATEFIAQAGDIVYEDGTGSVCVYDGDVFDTETNNLTFWEPYLLAAAKRSDGKIGSQFFITFEDLPQLNGEYCIFGRIYKGKEIFDTMNLFGSMEGKPQGNVIIKRCGFYQPKEAKKYDLRDFNPEMEKRRQDF